MFDDDAQKRAGKGERLFPTRCRSYGSAIPREAKLAGFDLAIRGCRHDKAYSLRHQAGAPLS